MIIIGFLNLVTLILNLLFGLIQPLIPKIGPEVTEIIKEFMVILDKGIDLFCFLLGPVASVLVAYILAFQVAKSTWDLVWFIIRKIPMFNIRE